MSKKKPISPEAEKRAETMLVHREKRGELWHRLAAVRAAPEQYIAVMRLYTAEGPAAAEALVVEIEQHDEQ